MTRKGPVPIGWTLNCCRASSPYGTPPRMWDGRIGTVVLAANGP